MKDTTQPSELNTGQGTKRFKFQSFNTRVEKIKVDVIRRSRLVDDDPEDNGSFFNDGLEQWKELNLTKHFQTFEREITPLVKTLASIVYYKDKIIDILEKHLKVPDSLALDGLLDLITKLARDLEGDFYPYFPRLFACIIPLVYHRDVRLLESVFNCIAYLFKFLARQLTPDLCETFSMLSRLLGEDHETKPYIRHFTAESFAFLMRKARGPDLHKLVAHILNSLRADGSEEYVEGLAMLFFECVKQVDHQLHSRAVAVYRELLHQTIAEDVTVDELPQNASQRLLLKTTLLMLHHAYRNRFNVILELVLDDVDKVLKQDPLPEKSLAVLVSVLTMVVTVRKSSRVENVKAVVDRVQKIAERVFTNPTPFSQYLSIETLRTTTGLLSFGSIEVIASGGRLILESLMSFDDVTLVYGFFLGLANLRWSNLTQIALPYIVRYASLKFDSHKHQTILFLSEVMTSNTLVLTPGMLSSTVSAEGLIRFPATKKGSLPENILEILNKKHDWRQERDSLNAIDSDSNTPASIIPVISAILSLVPVIQMPLETTFSALLSVFDSLHYFISEDAKNNTVSRVPFVLGHINFSIECLMGLTIESLARMVSSNGGHGLEQLTKRHSLLFTNALELCNENEVVLRGLVAYMKLLKPSEEHRALFSVEEVAKVYELVKFNLNSYQPNIRLESLRLLALYEQPMMKTDAEHPVEEPCELVNVALEMDEIVPTMKNYRDKIVLIQRLHLILSTKRAPELYDDFVIRICFGLYTINFRPMWEEARKILKSCAEINRELYWTLSFAELAKFDDERKLVRDGFSLPVLDALSTPDEAVSGEATKTGTISFECPTHNTYIHAENKAWEIVGKKSSVSYAMLFVKLCDQHDPKIDFWNYYNCILMTLKETPSVTEQRSRHLMPLFFRFLEVEFGTLALDEINDDEEEDEEKEKETKKLDLLPRTSRVVKGKMANWLKLFSTFVNPRMVYKSAELHTVLMNLLAKGDTKLQEAAIECLFTWKEPDVTPYQDNLRNLLNDSKFRDELTAMLANEEQTIIDPAHRAGLTPYLMRILFGRLVQGKGGKSSGKTNKGSRRKAVLGAVSCCRHSEIQYFLDLALEPFKDILTLPGVEEKDGQVVSFSFDDKGGDILKNVAWRKQIGTLNLIDDMLKQMGSHLLPFLPILLKVVLYFIHYAHRRSSNDMDVDEEKTQDEQSSRSREVRALALKRVVDFFKLNGNFDFKPYMPAMFASFINPRLAKLQDEASQNASSILNLFVVWSERASYVRFFVDYNDQVLPQIYSVLSAKKLHEQALSVILDITENVLSHCESEMEVDGAAILKDSLVLPYVDLLLSHLQFRLLQSKDDVKFGSGRYSVREIAIVSRVAKYTNDGEQAAVIINLLLPSLRKSSRIIPERTKEHILSIWSKFIRIVPGFEADSTVYHLYYGHLAPMFATSQTRSNRLLLVDIFDAFVQINPALAKVGSVLRDLNSYSPRRLDELDFDRMLDALTLIGDELYAVFDHHQWLPVLHQLAFCMHEPTEMAIRGSATHCMVRFINVTKDHEEDEEKRKLMALVHHVLYPSIKTGFLERIELVRVEFVNLLNNAVKAFPTISIFTDLVPLLGDGDEEINFFNNIYHMQIHRRVRAMARLADISETKTFKPATINSIFMPLISAFFYESDRMMDHNLIHQCIKTVSSLAKLLPWNHYYNLLKHYLSMISRKEEMEKIFVRIVTGILEAFHFDLSHVVVTDETAKNIMGRQKVRIDYLTSQEIIARDAADNAETQGIIPEEIEEDKEVVAKKDQAERIHDILITKVLPELNAYLNNHKSKKSVLVRVPVALGIAKLLRALPERSMRLNLPALLTNMCQILRSRAQDVRDMTRETIVKINAFLGPSYFSFIIKELKTSLQRGYELHVLGFTVNVLINDMMPRLEVGQLDYCMGDIVSLLVSDIFGSIGQEKDSDEMTGKTMEARSNKSPATFELLAKIVRFKNVGILLMPLKDIMSETESLKILKKVDDILSRIATGLVNNPEFESQELLDFAHGLISENVETFKIKTKTKVSKTQKEKNFEVQMKRNVVETVDYYRANVHRFVYFGLSLLYTALRKSKSVFKTEEYKDQLDKFVDVIGNTLYSNQTTNVILASKIMCIMVTLPLPSIPESVPVVVKRTFALIKSTGNTHSKLAQACIKLLTICIRDTKQSTLTEQQLTYLLNIVRPDMEEPDRQSTVFSLVRAILMRKFMAPEMYDLMDLVSNIMVTNQAKEIREQARSVYFLFLMDYPQGRGRLKTQMSFIIKNLEYVYESGRESIMELLHHIIAKFGDEILEEFSEAIFLALVMRLVNDESAKCREMAAALIKALLERSEDRMKTIYKLLNTWLDSDKANLQRAGCQVYGLAIDTFGEGMRSQAPKLIEKLTRMLEVTREQIETLMDSDDETEENVMDVDSDIEWEVGYYALNTFAKLAKTFPKLIYAPGTMSVWKGMEEVLLHPHTWIRASAARLYGVYFANIDPETRHTTTGDDQSSYLTLETLRILAVNFVEQMKSKHLTEDQANQIVKNLFFIGKCMYYLSAEEDIDERSETKADEEEKEEQEEGVDTEIEAKLDEASSKRSLNWLFRRISFTIRGAAMKRQKNFLLCSSAFKWFAAMCNFIPSENLAPYLLPVITPLYYVVNDANSKDEQSVELKQFGNEVLGMIQKKAGTTVYFAAYQRVRQKVTKSKEERKAKLAIEAVVNPELAAKRKILKQQKNRDRKRTRFH
ncbi:armadillo-type protein [Phycomyces blakesleeanus]